MTELRGVDVHGGLRVRLEYDKTDRIVHARYSAEAGVDPGVDVAREIARLRSLIGYLEAWLSAWRTEVGQ